MPIGVYPGSFDPVTNGHMDLIRRGAKLVDHLIVAVLNNSQKQPMFEVQERRAMLEELTADLPNVEIRTFSGLLVHFMEQEGATVNIRGLRAVSDYEYELQMAQTNYSMDQNVETVFLVARNEYAYLSSSIVKEIARYKGDISKMVPAMVEEKIVQKY